MGGIVTNVNVHTLRQITVTKKHIGAIKCERTLQSDYAGVVVNVKCDRVYEMEILESRCRPS